MAQNPFFDFDFSKIVSEYKLPGVDVEALVSAQRRNIEAITAANQLAFEGLQAVGVCGPNAAKVGALAAREGLISAPSLSSLAGSNVASTEPPPITSLALPAML